MLTVNLLPAEEKINILDSARARIIFFFAFLATGIFIMGAIFLFLSYLPLLRSLQTANTELKIEEKTVADFHVHETIQQIKSTVVLFSSLRSFFEKPQNVSLLLENFLSHAKGISIISLTINKEGVLSLRGRAETRKELLDFEYSLREAGVLENLSLPLSQIIHETDISFSLDGKLKQEKRLPL